LQTALSTSVFCFFLHLVSQGKYTLRVLCFFFSTTLRDLTLRQHEHNGATWNRVPCIATLLSVISQYKYYIRGVHRLMLQSICNADRFIDQL
jgi:hypothetical protein